MGLRAKTKMVLYKMTVFRWAKGYTDNIENTFGSMLLFFFGPEVQCYNLQKSLWPFTVLHLHLLFI